MGKAQALRLGLKAANVALKATFAPQCAVCTKPLAAPIDGCVCTACWAAIAPAPWVAWPAGVITRAAAAGDYVGSLREIIHAFKYQGRRSLAAPLGSLMRTHGRSVLEGATHIVPVPLHPWRRMQRGFNQAIDLAHALDLPVASILWRRRRTIAQADLTAAERWRNVQGAFAVSPLASRRCRAALRGAVVVLVDDVRTTGATLHACAEVLVGVNVAEVRVLTAAVRTHDGRGYSSSGSTAP